MQLHEVTGGRNVWSFVMLGNSGVEGGSGTVFGKQEQEQEQEQEY